VLPFSVGIRDGVVHLVSTLGSAATQWGFNRVLQTQKRIIHRLRTARASPAEWPAARGGAHLCGERDLCLSYISLRSVAPL
jgi:hypothetical protein